MNAHHRLGAHPGDQPERGEHAENHQQIRPAEAWRAQGLGLGQQGHAARQESGRRLRGPLHHAPLVGLPGLLQFQMDISDSLAAAAGPIRSIHWDFCDWIQRPPADMRQELNLLGMCP